MNGPPPQLLRTEIRLADPGAIRLADPATNSLGDPTAIHYPGPSHRCVATLGDGKIESVVRRRFGDLLPGTRLYGQVWTSGGEVVIRYTRAVVPSGEDYGDLERDFPICVALGLNGGEKKLPGSKPGAALVPANAVARFIHGRWP